MFTKIMNFCPTLTFSLALTGLAVFEDFFSLQILLHILVVNYNSVCRRAPATPGLINILIKANNNKEIYQIEN